MKSLYKLLTAICLIALVCTVPAFATVTQTNTTDGAYNVIIFNGTGSVNWTSPNDVINVTYLVVAGGGGGGGSPNAVYGGGGGGGGAGGLLTGNFSPNTSTTYNITIGGGGPIATNGSNSSITNGTLNISAMGGGGGGTEGNYHGKNGGSGGGGSGYLNGEPGGYGLSGQGYGGGSSYGNGGGGGGAGANGTNAYTIRDKGGPGGIGIASSITGTSIYYAGGGAGGGQDGPNPGATGGGGNGGWYSGGIYNGTNGTNGLGGGGGGGCYYTGVGGYGGSGIVILRYAISSTNFTSNVTNTSVSGTVQFNDTSETIKTAWAWDFGDGTNSTDQNPNHTYSTPGSYTVKLNATGPNGTFWCNKTDYINVNFIGFNQTSYFPNTYATVGWYYPTSLWNTTEYDYKVNIYKDGTLIQATTAVAINSSTTFTSTSAANITANLTYNPKSNTSNVIVLGTASVAYRDVVQFQGYAVNAYNGAGIAGATVNLTQSGNTTSVTTNATGYYICNTTFSSGINVTINATQTNYTQANFSYTFTSAGLYTVNMTMMPINGTDPTAAPIIDGFPIWNGTSIIGIVYGDPYNNGISGAALTCGGLNTNSTTGGYYHFDNLSANTSYTVAATYGGYNATAPVSVTTGSDNTSVQQNIPLSQTFSVVVNVVDSRSSTTVAGSSTVTVNGGSAQTATNGVTNYTLNYGYYTFAATATGYSPGSTAQTISSSTTVYISMTPLGNATSQNQNLLYTPHLVRMYFIDEWGNRLSGLTITATPTGQSSVPTSWLDTILGLPTNASMTNTTLSGTSAADGSIAFLMVEVLQYNVTAVGNSPINGAVINNAILFYPKDTDYDIKIRTGLHMDLQEYPTYYLNATPSADETTVNLSMFYSGTNTTGLTFYVIKNNNTTVYTSVLGTGGSASYVANNTRGDYYTYGFNATNSLGQNNVIQQWQDVAMKGTGPLFNFGLDATTRLWISIVAIFFFASIWGATSMKQGVFLTPFLAGGFFWYIGWLPASLGVIIFAMCFIGGLIYMRAQENKAVRA